MLQSYEVPIAYSMVELVKQQNSKQLSDPFQEFMCYWIAFNNIYTTITEMKGRVGNIKTDANGSIQTRLNGSNQIPVIFNSPNEAEELDIIFNEFDHSLKNILILHPNTEFFVNRKPQWHGSEIESDSLGQQVNGVLNLRYTVNSSFPVWSPIDIPAYQRYRAGQPVDTDEDLLARQILILIYTIRNNTFHGGKRADDANDRKVIEKGTPLLIIILNHFMHL